MSEAAAKPPRMTVEEFLIWAEGRPGRHELHDGEVVTMQSERVAHVVVKGSVHLALRDALRRAGVPCTAFPDGVTVRINARTACEPDCTIHRGAFNLDDLVVSNPVVVVEILSPSSQSADVTTKLAGYFQVASIMHYLIVQPDKRLVVHYQRNGGDIAVRILDREPDAMLRLDPPGIAVEIGEFFADLDEG